MLTCSPATFCCRQNSRSSPGKKSSRNLHHQTSGVDLRGTDNQLLESIYHSNTVNCFMRVIFPGWVFVCWSWRLVGLVWWVRLVCIVCELISWDEGGRTIGHLLLGVVLFFFSFFFSFATVFVAVVRLCLFVTLCFYGFPFHTFALLCFAHLHTTPLPLSRIAFMGGSSFF
jgi:hypothetical protein